MKKRGYVLNLEEIDKTLVALVGGKGANLGELSRIPAIHVPAGFCVTTEAFRRVMAQARSGEAIGTIAIPDDIVSEIAKALADLGERASYAVRSSATAEDSPSMSFAGQHDSYLNVSGRAEILRHIRRCWASLFSERAVAYRARNGVDDSKVLMAVVVQRMVDAHASGVLFTADPLTGN